MSAGESVGARTKAGVGEEQLLYARVLAVGMYTGLLTLLVTFALYLGGVVEPAIPIDELPRYWTMDVQTYLEAANHEYLHRSHELIGWWWVTALGRGDFLTFVGIAFLSAVTPMCFLAIVPMLLRKGDRIFAAIALAEVVILALAASGVLMTGAH